MLDELWIRSLHVSSLRRRDLHPEHEDHVVFQASTIEALLDGAYEGDVSIERLAEHGDHGVGTLNGLDGELTALDGEFFRADHSGDTEPVAPGALTPFAVVAWFSPEVRFSLPRGAGLRDLSQEIDARLPNVDASLAVRVDGEFAFVRARSVPRQDPPYRPLTEVIAEQTVFELEGVRGTLVGFRFPDLSAGIEAAGYHLHFITADRRRGGHVLEFRAGGELCAAADSEGELRVELPPGVDLEGSRVDAELREALDRVERAG